MSDNPAQDKSVDSKQAPEEGDNNLPMPENRDSGFSDKAVKSRLLTREYSSEHLGDRERDAAYAAWMRTYSERRSKRATAFSILAAALALTGGFASSSTALPAGIAYAGVGLVVVLGGFFIGQLYLGRGREAIEAAAAVHQLRSEEDED